MINGQYELGRALYFMDRYLGMVHSLTVALAGSGGNCWICQVWSKEEDCRSSLCQHPENIEEKALDVSNIASNVAGGPGKFYICVSRGQSEEVRT